MKLFDYVHQGGPIMYILVTLNFFGLALLFFKTWEIFQAKKNKSTLIDDVKNYVSSNYDTVGDKVVMIELIKEEIKSRVDNLGKGLNTIKIIASISPLLGLLGTVIGIFLSFRVISEQGLSNHSLFAEGISLALITTVGGLIVAIPHIIGYNYLMSNLDVLEAEVEKTTLPQIIK